MRPVGQNILIKPDQGSEQSEGGIFVPLTARRPSNKGTVIAVGAGSKLKPMKFREGQTAYRVKEWGEEILIDGELHFLMNQDALIAIE